MNTVQLLCEQMTNPLISLEYIYSYGVCVTNDSVETKIKHFSYPSTDIIYVI